MAIVFQVSFTGIWIVFPFIWIVETSEISLFQVFSVMSSVRSGKGFPTSFSSSSSKGPKAGFSGRRFTSIFLFGDSGDGCIFVLKHYSGYKPFGLRCALQKRSQIYLRRNFCRRSYGFGTFYGSLSSQFGEKSFPISSQIISAGDSGGRQGGQNQSRCHRVFF